MKNFFCICFSATLQRTISFDSVKLEHVNRSKKYRIDASGKAVNSARVLSQLENNCVTTFCPLGINNQKEFIELAQRDNLNLIYSTIPGNTRECWTLLDTTKETTTELVVGEPVISTTPELEKTQNSALKDTIPSAIGSADAVLLAGSRPAIWPESAYPEIAKLAVESGKIFLADYIGQDLINTLKVCTPTIIKINDEEFCNTFGLNYPTEDEKLKSAIIEKSKELNNIIVVTRGTKSTYGAEKGNFEECSTEKVKAVNTTACGDSFNAGFIYEYANTQNFKASLKKGTWCAARNAERECPGDVK